MAVLRLRWNHLGANFVYLGAHNGDTTSALPKAIQKCSSKCSPQWPCSSTIATHARKKGARLAVLQLRWNHLGANFVYHHGDTTSALPKATQKYTSKHSPQWPCRPSKNQRSNQPKAQTRRNEKSSKNVPPKRSHQWPCSPTIAAHARKKRPSKAICIAAELREPHVSGFQKLSPTCQR